MGFSENLGFTGHPFVKTNADEEENLAKYFVAPPFFTAVVGDPARASATIVLAPRGGGKTALRLMVEQTADENRFLPVTYDRFEFGAGQRLEDITLAYHLRSIIKKILVRFFLYLADDQDLIFELGKQDKRLLSSLVHTYLGDMTGTDFNESIRSIRNVPQRILDYWKENLGILQPLVLFLEKKYDLDAVCDDLDKPAEGKTLAESYKYQLEVLASLLKRLGFSSIYVLVDRLDETEKTGGSAEHTYQLVRPILLDLELLGMADFGFKVFVWDKILEHFAAEGRPDRIAQHNITWSRQRLQEMLSARLSAFSEGRITSFAQLLDAEVPFDPDVSICFFAHNSPRNVIRICEKILAVRGEDDPSSHSISSRAIDQGILLHCHEVTSQIYGDDQCQDLKRIGCGLFTIPQIASNVFKISENACRNKVTKWQKSGAVIIIDTIVGSGGAGRPINLYCISDPSLIRIIHEVVPLEDLIRDMLHECAYCHTEMLIDINTIPTGWEPKCVGCKRNLY